MSAGAKHPRGAMRLRMPECHVCACPPDGLPNNEEKLTMKVNDTTPPAPLGRVIGLDLHPDVLRERPAGRGQAGAHLPQWPRPDGVATGRADPRTTRSTAQLSHGGSERHPRP